jgi:DNA-binding PadR family transcriptional regulator
LVRDGLARQDGYLQGRPYYRITDAGRQALHPKETR